VTLAIFPLLTSVHPLGKPMSHSPNSGLAGQRLSFVRHSNLICVGKSVHTLGVSTLDACNMEWRGVAHSLRRLGAGITSFF